jgi:hypothetical protein
VDNLMTPSIMKSIDRKYMHKLFRMIFNVFLGIVLAVVLQHFFIEQIAPKDIRAMEITQMVSTDSTGNNFTEVDGIRFETLVPNPVLKIPDYGEEVIAQFGVRITNQSAVPYRFNLPSFLPEFLDQDDQVKPMRLAGNMRRRVEDSDIPIVLPGKSLTFLMDTQLSWYCNCLFVRGNVDYGLFWTVFDLKPGVYQIRFRYEFVSSKRRLLFSSGKLVETQDFWIGNVITSTLKFILSEK